jgi:apolipoprotein N-acyltransferase
VHEPVTRSGPPHSVPSAAGESLGALRELGLLLASALLFALSFPSFASRSGWFPLAFIALAPLLVAVRSASWPRCVAWGPLYGFLSYALYNFWLAKFHPITIFVVPPIHAVYFLVLLPLLKLPTKLFPRAGFAVQALIWVGYEYLKIQGFLGYPWGVMGYSQYQFLALIGVARLGGVWAVSLLVVFPSALMAEGVRRLRTAARLPLVSAAAYAVVFCAALAYSAATRVDVSKDPTRRFALVQQNADPWKTEYAGTLDSLIRLSTAAMLSNPDIVVWSETSFVPAIDWHTRYRTEPAKYELVKRLRDFLSSQTVPFVLGNDDGRLTRDASGKEIRVDYNAALLFEGGEVKATYRKLHLVPFTEHFPFERTLPRITAALASNPDIHFWQEGEEPTVFEAAGIRFSTPICFEDSFGYLSRLFVRHGAEVIVNLTNDAWSKSVPAEMQHMGMAVFRALENGRSVVRSTNGGMTVTIDPNGRILHALEPFVESYLVTDVPVHTATRTLYTAWGDWLGIATAAAAVAAIALGLALRVAGAARRDAGRGRPAAGGSAA